MDRSLASFSLLSEKEIVTQPWLKHEVKKKEDKKQNNHINVEKMDNTIKYATYVAEKSKPENFQACRNSNPAISLRYGWYFFIP